MCSFTLSPDLLCLSFLPPFFPVFHTDPRNAAAGENETGVARTDVHCVRTPEGDRGVECVAHYTTRTFFSLPLLLSNVCLPYPSLPSSYRSPPSLLT